MLRTPDEAYKLAEQRSKEYTEKFVAEQMDGVPVDHNFVHTDNNYTTAEKQKLADINNVANLTYVTVSS